MIWSKEEAMQINFGSFEEGKDIPAESAKLQDSGSLALVNVGLWLVGSDLEANFTKLWLALALVSKQYF